MKTTQKQDLLDLTSKIGNLIYQIQDLIEDNLESKGLKEEDCQKLYVLNRLSELENSISGIEQEDLK